MKTDAENVKLRQNTGDHLANERTFLAWIRTSIGIIGLGFVVVKFSIFVRQISAALGEKNIHPPTGYSPIIGILLVVLGAMATLFSYIRYIKTRKMLDAGEYYHSTILVKFVTAAIFLISLILIAYLIEST